MTESPPRHRKRRVLVVVALAELLAMSLWFSATAAAPELATEWGRENPRARRRG
jgi:hypothetical protein